METIKISRDFRIVIPKKIREALKLLPGQKLRIYLVDGSIHISSRSSIESLRGIAKGMQWKDSYRDRNDRY